jgi:hypothetical protein
VKANRDIYRAKNSEIPFLLQRKGQLTTEEDRDIQYTNLHDQEKFFVGDDARQSFNGAWLNEMTTKIIKTLDPNLHTVWDVMAELRKIILERDPEFPTESRLERLLKGSNAGSGQKQRQDITLGFTNTPQEDSIQMQPVTSKMMKPENLKFVSRATYLSSIVATEVLRFCAPPEVVKLLEEYTLIQGSNCIGHAESLTSKIY